MSRFNAYLDFTSPKGRQIYRLWIDEYIQVHTLAGTSSQSKLFSHFYPRSYSPGAISFKGKVPSQTDYNNLATYIRNHHELLMRSPGMSNLGTTQLPLMSMKIPSEGVTVVGVIERFTAGAKRFAVAPPFEFDFTVINDAHSKNTNIHPGFSKRAMWTGDFIDEGKSTPAAKTVSQPVKSSLNDIGKQILVDLPHL
jgi:hypothetical protein